MVNKTQPVSVKKKKVKRLSANSSTGTTYYPSAFITNPCEQLFGPSLNHSIELDTSDSKNNRSTIDSISSCVTEPKVDHTNEFVQTSMTASTVTSAFLASNYDHLNIDNSGRLSGSTAATTLLTTSTNEQQFNSQHENEQENAQQNDFEYIPAPRWNKAQNSLLEELFKKSRYPKPAELKSFAQRFNVMDTDIEDWFRKRRGRDRKTRRKNEALKNLIDNYLGK